MKKLLKIALMAMTVVLLLGVYVGAEGVISFDKTFIWVDGEPGVCKASLSDPEPDHTIKSVTWSAVGDCVTVDETTGNVTAAKAGTGYVVALYSYEDEVMEEQNGSYVTVKKTVQSTAMGSVEVRQNALTSISAAAKTAFLDKQEIKASDFEVTGEYEDGVKRPITNFTIDKKEATAPSTEVTISVGNITTKVSFPVTKIDPTDLVKSFVVSAPAENTTFKVGDTLKAADTEIRITDIYNGISYKKVNGSDVKWDLNGTAASYTFSADDAKAGTKRITVTYADKTASVDVKVVTASGEDPVDSAYKITYATNTAARTSYHVGDKFDATGYSFKIADSADKNITSKCTGLKLSSHTFTADDVGTKASITLTATFTYNGKTCTASVKIENLTVKDGAEELNIYEITGVVLNESKYPIGYEFDTDALDEEIDYITLTVKENSKRVSKKIYGDELDDYDHEFELVVLDQDGDTKSRSRRYLIEEDDVFEKSGKDVVNLLFIIDDTDEYQFTVPVGDSGVKFFYLDDLIADYEDLEDALYYTGTQDKDVEEDFELDDVRDSKSIVLKLGEDMKISSSYDFDPEHNVEIDLNGHNLTFYSDTVNISKNNREYTVTVTNSAKSDAVFTYSDKKTSITLKQGDTLVFEYAGDLPGFVTVTVNCGKNGIISEKTNTIKNNEIQLGKGATLTFTIKPDTGYEIKTVTVDGKSVIPTSTTSATAAVYTVSTAGTATYTMKDIAKNCTLEATFAEKKEEKPAWTNPFTDITSRDKYYSAVEFVCTNELFNGVSATKFAPENTMTRAMFVTVLGRLAAKTQNIDFTKYNTSSFTDVSASNPQNGYAAPYIEWASRTGIVEGYGDGTFGPNNNITHQQMYLMMQRYASFVEHKYTDASQSTLTVSDASQVASWAVNGVKYAQQQNILISTRVDPTGNALRWELATELRLFCKNVLGWDLQ